MNTVTPHSPEIFKTNLQGKYLRFSSDWYFLKNLTDRVVNRVNSSDETKYVTGKYIKNPTNCTIDEYSTPHGPEILINQEN